MPVSPSWLFGCCAGLVLSIHCRVSARVCCTVCAGVPGHPLIWQRHLKELMDQVVSRDPPLTGENHRCGCDLSSKSIFLWCVRICSPALFWCMWCPRIHKLVITSKCCTRYLVVTAWNEWGESCALEPDRAFGRGLLEGTKEAMTAKGGWGSRRRVVAGASCLLDNPTCLGWPSRNLITPPPIPTLQAPPTSPRAPMIRPRYLCLLGSALWTCKPRRASWTLSGC